MTDLHVHPAANRPYDADTPAAGDWQRRIAIAHDRGQTHPCCVAGCTNDTLLGLLACREHWLSLPRSTRYVLGHAFRRHDTHPEIFNEAVALARRLLNENAAA